MEESLEYFIQLKFKANPLVFQDDINNHNFNIEYDLIDNMKSSRDVFPPLSSNSHSPLSLDFLDQSL